MTTAEIGQEAISQKSIKPLLLEAFNVQGARNASRKAGEGLSGKIIKLAIRAGNAGGLERVKQLTLALCATHAFIKELEAEGISFEMKKDKLKVPAAWSGPFNTAANVYKFGLKFTAVDKTTNKEYTLTESALRKEIASVMDTQRVQDMETTLLEHVGKDGTFLYQRCQAAISFLSKSMLQLDIDTLRTVSENLEEAHTVAKAYAEAQIAAEVNKVVPPVGEVAETEAKTPVKAKTPRRAKVAKAA